MPPVRKTPLLGQFYIKTIILPRQARDKHRESTQKRTVLSQATGANLRDSGRRSSRAISRRSSRCVQCHVSAHPHSSSSVLCCVATHPARGARAGRRRCCRRRLQQLSCRLSAAHRGCFAAAVLLAGRLPLHTRARPGLSCCTLVGVCAERFSCLCGAAAAAAAAAATAVFYRCCVLSLELCS